MKRYAVLIIAAVFFLTGCRQEALLTGLDQVQANEVVALLQKNNISAIKTDQAKAGYSVSVSPADFATAVDLMTTYNLPSKARVEIAQMFPADALISSPRAEVARIYSAIEQRLEQTLGQLEGVISSRVHVSYDMSNTDAQKNLQPVHISALLSIQAVASETNLIADAKKLLKNSFSKVDYENISVVLTPVSKTLQFQPSAVEHGGKGIVNGWLMLVAVSAVSAVLAGCGAIFFLRMRPNAWRHRGADGTPEENL